MVWAFPGPIHLCCHLVHSSAELSSWVDPGDVGSAAMASKAPPSPASVCKHDDPVSAMHAVALFRFRPRAVCTQSL